MVSFSFKSWLESATLSQPCVLMSLGAYNPIHRGHVKMFYHAKNWLASKNHDVIAGYAIPRNYNYVQSKGDAMDDNHRYAMIELALQGTFIKVLPLEKNMDKFLSYDAIRQEVAKLHPGVPSFFVVGTDKMQCQEGQDVCVVNDPKWGRTVVISRNLAGDASSTKIRNSIHSSGDEPEPHLLSPANHQYVHKFGLWGAK
jgi:nicotinic acid mononucleotide adenylyltransferase